jgi:hypothetical protein
MANRVARTASAATLSGLRPLETSSRKCGSKKCRKSRRSGATRWGETNSVAPLLEKPEPVGREPGPRGGKTGGRPSGGSDSYGWSVSSRSNRFVPPPSGNAVRS